VVHSGSRMAHLLTLFEPQTAQVLVRSVVTERDSIRSTSVAADARIDNGDAWLHVYHSKDGTVAVPGACAASQPVGETTEAADAVRRVQVSE